MATNRLEANPAEAAADTARPASAEPGGFKAWLPLITNLMLMPALAYGMTTFVLLPKLRSGDSAPHSAPVEKGSHGSDHGGGESGGKNKFTANLSGKILVNVAGTAGTRYLLATFTLVSPNPQLKSIIEKNDAQLRDVASGVLASKTISDLEKPGARNLIRTELISVLNGVLGNGVISEIYITEFAFQ
jgi:flagellar FliL protein